MLANGKKIKTRKFLSIFTILCLLITSLQFGIVNAAEPDKTDVVFLNYDMSYLNGAEYNQSNVTIGSRLYSKDEISQAIEGKVADFTPTDDASWYLWDGTETPPVAITDPQGREGYQFVEWVSSNSAPNADEKYVVKKDTQFIARYNVDGKYLINLYFRFNNPTSTVASDTISFMAEDNEEYVPSLPDGTKKESLKGLTPIIVDSYNVLSGSENNNAQEIKDAIETLSNMISPNGSGGYKMTFTLNDDFLDLCKKAGFVSVDKETGKLAEDQLGNIRINIPITYNLSDEIGYNVRYLLQNADDDHYTQEGDEISRTTTGTTEVNLEKEGLVKNFDGYTLTKDSEAISKSYNINPDNAEQSTIELKYNRNVHYIIFQTGDGKAISPIAVKYGQQLSSVDIPETAQRQGYTFAGWKYSTADNPTQTSTRPETMPDTDLIMTARWTAGNSSVKLVYWLENANDDNYTNINSITLNNLNGNSLKSDRTIGFSSTEYYNVSSFTDLSNSYGATNLDVALGLKSNEGKYFSFNRAKTLAENTSAMIKGDGSTTLNLYFDRNIYTLYFHIGRYNSSMDYGEVSIGGGSTSASDWLSGFSWASPGELRSSWWDDKDYYRPFLKMGGVVYEVPSNNNSLTELYSIKAKYGANIGNLWPTANDENSGSLNNTWADSPYINWTDSVENKEVEPYFVDSSSNKLKLFTWGTMYGTPYYTKNSNKNIIGRYETMDSLIIPNGDNPSVAHHLVAYWARDISSNSKNYHIMIEDVQGVEHSGTSQTYDQIASGKNLQKTVNSPSNSLGSDKFYEKQSYEVRTSAAAALQNAGSITGMDIAYVCYNRTGTKGGYGDGKDVYIFYKYTRHTAVFDDNNSLNTTPSTKTIKEFIYLEDGNLASFLRATDGTILSSDVANSMQPSNSYVSEYGNDYEFKGWYKDPEGTEEVDWSTENPSENITYYAKWEAPKFTMNIKVRDGRLQNDTISHLEGLESEGIDFSAGEPDDNGVITYTISNIPEGTSASHIIGDVQTAVSDIDQIFDYWITKNGDESNRFIFDETQKITSNLTVEASWRKELTGEYKVQYLTETDNGGETVEVNGETYYVIREADIIKNIPVGSNQTVKPVAISGYLPMQSQLTQKVKKPLVEGGEPVTIYNFIYEPIQDDDEITYYVHYVLDKGEDYGTSENQSVTKLAPDKVITLSGADVRELPQRVEYAQIISGYIPKDSWLMTSVLSANDTHNHFYIYYRPNTQKADYKVTMFIPDENGRYSADNSIVAENSGSFGEILVANDIFNNYTAYFSDEVALQFLEENGKHMEVNSFLTENFKLLTGEEKPNYGANQYYIFLKYKDYNISYHLNKKGDFDPEWNLGDSDIRQSNDDISLFINTVKYPKTGTLPTENPKQFGYKFLGWTLSPDGSGTVYSADGREGTSNLSDLEFYNSSFDEDKDLYAKWEPKQKIVFDLNGGSWTNPENKDVFRNVDGNWITYSSVGEAIEQPTDPSMSGYSFLGWSTVDYGSNAPESIADLDSNRADFSSASEGETVIHAVWMPNLTHTIKINLENSYNGDPIPDGTFTIQKVNSKIKTSGDLIIYEQSGDDVVSGTEKSITIQNGTATVGNLSSGVYKIKRDVIPNGYSADESTESIVIMLPVGVDSGTYVAGEGVLVSPTSSDYVSSKIENNMFTLIVKYIAEYRFSISGDTEISLNYKAPDVIWNPNKLQYEMTADEKSQPVTYRWNISSHSITVSNDSEEGIDADVSVTMSYKSDYNDLLIMTDLSVDGVAQNLMGITSKTYRQILAGQSNITLEVVPSSDGNRLINLSRDYVTVGSLSIRVDRHQ